MALKILLAFAVLAVFFILYLTTKNLEKKEQQEKRLDNVFIAFNKEKQEKKIFNKAFKDFEKKSTTKEKMIREATGVK